MLEIYIVDNSGDNLKLKVNGHPNNGYSEAKRNWPVHWRVEDGSGVTYIESISMKSCRDNTNIFPAHQPPRALGPDRKHWGGIVRPNAPIGGEYQYNIKWVKDGESHVRTYDPIIAIRPTVPPPPPLPALVAIVMAILAFFGVSLLFKRKRKKGQKV